MARKPKFADWPFVLRLRTGKLVFRHPLIGQKTLPDDINSEAFAAAYEALRLLIAAPAGPKAAPVKLPTFADAYIEWKKSDEWKSFEGKTLAGHIRHARAFLESPMVRGSLATFAEAEVATPEHEVLPLLRKAVASHAPHKAKRVAVAIRKLYAAAIDQEWCLRNLGNDLQKVELPEASPQKPWPAEIIEQFERHHQPGSAARTCFALARFLGNRRGDVATVRWSQLRPHRYIDGDEIKVTTVIEFETQKNAHNGRNAKVLLFVSPELEIVLNALDRSKAGTILKTVHGNAFSQKSLTNQMATWCAQAGIAPGYSLHGLRRSFASELAEGGADLFAVQKAMGHKNPTTTQLYLKELNAEPMAQRAAAAASKRSAEVKRLRAADR